jgi:hypothetical protein
LSPPIFALAFTLVQRAPALLAASAGMTAVVAISKAVEARRVVTLPMDFNVLRTTILP